MAVILCYLSQFDARYYICGSSASC